MRRIVIALAILAAAVGGLLFMRARQEERARVERRETRLLEFDERRVEAIELDVEGVHHRFEQLEDGWWMVSPHRDRADATSLSELMSLSRRSPVVLRIEQPEDASAYGLDPARVAIRFEGVDAPELRLGEIAPDQSGLYGALEGSGEVLVIQAVPGSLLTHPDIARFREPSLTGIGRAGITELRVSREGSEPYAVRRVDGAWWLTEPFRVPANDRSIERLLEGLDSAEIVRTLDAVERHDPAFGLGAGGTVVDLVSSEGERVLRIGASSGIEDERYVWREDRPPVLVVRGLELDRIPDRPSALGDDTLTKVNRYRVRAWSYRAESRSVSAERSGDGWRSAGATVSEEAVFAFLVKALDAAVSEWTPRPNAPSGEPLAELSWTVEDGSRGRAQFWSDGSAVVDSVPGAVARLRGPPPTPPDLGR